MHTIGSTDNVDVHDLFCVYRVIESCYRAVLFFFVGRRACVRVGS